MVVSETVTTMKSGNSSPVNTANPPNFITSGANRWTTDSAILSRPRFLAASSSVPLDMSSKTRPL
ncbi:Uncharacterised protein [uncultured archaeon]|nr:Uncharacterised protein [uncultured archaeon]